MSKKKELPLGVCPTCLKESLVWFVGGIKRKIKNGKIVDVQVFQQTQTCSESDCGYTGPEDKRWHSALSSQRSINELARMEAYRIRKEAEKTSDETQG